MQVWTFSVLALCASAFGGLSGPAHANLITNGGFETGDLTEYTQGGNLGGTFAAGGPFAHSGIYGAALGPVGSDGTLTQTFATTPGTTYELIYWHFYPGRTPGDFSVIFLGQTFDGTVNATALTAYTQCFHDVIATGMPARSPFPSAVTLPIKAWTISRLMQLQ